MEIVSKGLAETAEFARRILAQIAAVKKSQATVLALYGDLGSAKTTFTQFLAKELGVSDYVTSPTFVIEKRYQTASGAPFKRLIHIDCYRLNNSDEMKHLGWTELAADPANLIVIEWPERIENILPKDTVKIEFAFVDENTRKISLK